MFDADGLLEVHVNQQRKLLLHIAFDVDLLLAHRTCSGLSQPRPSIALE